MRCRYRVRFKINGKPKSYTTFAKNSGEATQKCKAKRKGARIISSRKLDGGQ